MNIVAVMAMAVSRDNRIALTVSADHLIGRYDLAVRIPNPLWPVNLLIITCRRIAMPPTLTRRAQYIARNILETPLSLYEMTAEYAPWEDGMESTSSAAHSIIFEATCIASDIYAVGVAGRVHNAVRLHSRCFMRLLHYVPPLIATNTVVVFCQSEIVLHKIVKTTRYTGLSQEE